MNSRARSAPATPCSSISPAMGLPSTAPIICLPVDVPEAGPGEEGIVRDASFAATGLSDRCRKKAPRTVILILDACRDNPFAHCREAQHRAHARAFAHGPDRRHVRAVLGGARTVGARSFERDRLQIRIRCSRARCSPRWSARPIHGADRQEARRAKCASLPPRSIMCRCRPITIRSSAISISCRRARRTARRELSPRSKKAATPACCRRQSGRSGWRRARPRRSRASCARTAAGRSTSHCRRPRHNSAIASASKGEFTDAGLLDVLDQRTGARMPKTYFELPPDQGKTTTLCHLARQTRRAGRRLPDQFRSVRRACRRAEENSGRAVDGLDFVPRF